MRKSTVKTLTGVIITMSVVLVGTGAAAYLLKQQADENKAAYEEAQTTLDDNLRSVYVVRAVDEDGNPTVLPAGTEIDETNTEYIDIYSSLDADAYIDPDDFGKPLLADTPDGTPVLDIMVAQDEAEEGDRDYQIMVANLMESQAENDLVDIRIMMPNAEDYTILSKKRIENLDMENGTFTCLMNEEEILRMASATIDAYTFSGSYIYTVRYTEGTYSEETIPNYPVRSETISLMQTDPNVLTEAQYTLNQTVRSNLEDKLANLMKEHVEAVTTGQAANGNTDTAGGSIILRNSVSMEDDASSTTSSYAYEYDWDFDSELEDDMEELELEEEAETESDTTTETTTK